MPLMIILSLFLVTCLFGRNAKWLCQLDQLNSGVQSPMQKNEGRKGISRLVQKGMLIVAVKPAVHIY